MALDGATENERDAIWNATAEALQAFQGKDGVMRLQNETICLVAW